MRLRQRIPLSLLFAAVSLAYMAAAVALALLLSQWIDKPWQAGLISVAVLAPLLAYHVRRAFAPMHSLFRALAASVASYRDGDYGFGLSWDGRGELGDLVASHNALGDALREQRLSLVQRELLLDTMVQNTPVAMVLVDPSRRVVHANIAARKLLGDGHKLEGQDFDALLQWWLGENVKQRHVWPGLSVSKNDDRGLLEQIALVRQHEAEHPGTIIWSISGLNPRRATTQRAAGDLAKALASGPYVEKSVVPASPWLDSTPPKPPTASASR